MGFKRRKEPSAISLARRGGVTLPTFLRGKWLEGTDVEKAAIEAIVRRLQADKDSGFLLVDKDEPFSKVTFKERIEKLKKAVKGDD